MTCDKNRKKKKIKKTKKKRPTKNAKKKEDGIFEQMPERPQEQRHRKTAAGRKKNKPKLTENRAKNVAGNWNLI